MSMKHYIVRHTLVSSRGEVLGAKTFAPTDEKALSVFELKQKQASQLYATSSTPPASATSTTCG